MASKARSSLAIWPRKVRNMPAPSMGLASGTSRRMRRATRRESTPGCTLTSTAEMLSSGITKGCSA